MSEKRDLDTKRTDQRLDEIESRSGYVGGRIKKTVMSSRGRPYHVVCSLCNLRTVDQAFDQPVLP